MTDEPTPSEATPIESAPAGSEPSDDATQASGGQMPDRLSLNPRSPHFNQEILSQSVGIRFNGVEKTNVEEYCVSEGWIKVAAGRSRDRHGNPMTLKLKGQVEPYLENSVQPADPTQPTGEAGVADEG